MLTTIRKYARAFGLALRYTLRGEQPPLMQVRTQHPQIAAWWTETSRLLDAIERAADAAGIDAAARDALKLHVDKHDLSMTTILATIRYHAEHEYPYLLAHTDEFNNVTLQAINLNDRFLARQLSDAAPSQLQPSIDALVAHLDALPAIQ